MVPLQNIIDYLIGSKLLRKGEQEALEYILDQDANGFITQHEFETAVANAKRKAGKFSRKSIVVREAIKERGVPVAMELGGKDGSEPEVIVSL